MKIVNIDVNGEIILNSIEDTDNEIIKTINSKMRLPTGNVNSILLNFNFISPNIEGLNLFASFKVDYLENPIIAPIADVEIEEKTYLKACFIPQEVLQQTGEIEIGFFANKLDSDNSTIQRFSLEPIIASVVVGSYDENATEGLEPTPTVFEIYFDKINKSYEKFSNDLEKAITNEANLRENAINEEKIAREKANVNLQNQIDVEKARIDLLNTLEEGSTTGDAELIDGRISYDGVTYNNIGNAIRAQAKNNNQKIYAEQRRMDTQLNKHYNIIPIGAFYQGTINNNTGEISDSTTHIYTKDVYEMINNPMHMKIAEGYQLKLLWYSDKAGQNIVGFNSWYSGQNIIRLENTNGKYFRICLAKADVSAITPDDFTPDLLELITIPDSDNMHIATSGIQKSFDSFANENKFTLVFPDIKQGHIYTNSSIEGVSIDKSSNTSLYSKKCHYINADEINITIKEGYQYQLFWIDEEGKCVSGRGWYTNSQTRIAEAKYLQIGLRKADNSVFFAEDFTEDIISITYTPNGVIKNIQDTLNDLKYAILPSYWEDHINNKIEIIKAKELITDANGDSFIFMTDSHWPSNAKNSPALIKKILDNTNITKVFGGGDVINLHSSKSEAINYQRDFVKSFKDLNIDVLNILGNHDLNNNQATYGSEAYLNINEVYSTLFKSAEEKLNGMPKISETNGDSNRNMFYYIDNPVQKIRYIVLNNARSKIYYNANDPQLKFFKEKMQELPTGWTIVAFTHIYWSGISNGVPTENVYGTQITDLIDSVYDDLNATFAALIVGHCHYDFSKNSTKGYAVISTTSDAYQLSDTALSPVMTLGTITEQAFDVFNIDTTIRKIYATRIGAGEDREFSY